MCRWIAYAGEPLHPSTLVVDTPHSLVAQSLASELGKETVNGDGFGLGWYPAGAVPGSAPVLFRSVEPAWHDENLREIARAVESPLFFAHVRAASGPPIQQSNCHPFRHDNWLFMHNGSLRGFTAMRREIMLAIEPSLFPSVRGTTDSEALFHLALSRGLAHDPVAAMAAALGEVEAIGARCGVAHPVQGTFAVSDGSTLWAFRYSSEHHSRTLFHSADIEVLQSLYPDVSRLRVFGRGARVVVSEPLSDLPGAFVEVPESSVVIVDGTECRQEVFVPTA
ncbi:class II glutamine amidotransferase [Herbiconiux moechotypicola]|uniref:Class II glutamine amidotransferase n=1 Tax=Herbiconiux moechotypicola TaxID=637393 RepID=A0ABN3D937_9MICO|nr:class II glutamine amidotransferase [Herbiconiux moechotypicola]MCS5728234.1 class II glutamine amidotransferase [Herbiconiux moechotypicola]